jgi:ATP-dependent Clp protease ATP-binding subunit ClpC
VNSMPAAGSCRDCPTLFQIVPVIPFDRATALTVIDKQLTIAATGPGIEIGHGSGERIVRLFRRFMPYASFPGPAAAFARELVDAHTRRGRKPISPNDVVEQFRNRTGLPDLFLRDEIVLDRGNVLTWFRERVIDQPEACEAAANIVMTVKSGLNDPGRPPAVMLFCGPTGVGKTHMAQALADYFFGNSQEKSSKAARASKSDSKRVIRLDMSEYGGFDSVYRLIGPPQGEPGELVKQIRRQPFSVLLLDESRRRPPTFSMR